MAYRALEQPRIGWIGAGRMGLQMASRLLDAGHDVAIYNRTAAKAAPIISRGAVAVDRPADLADRDVVTWPTSRVATEGESTASPRAAARTPRRSSSGGESFSR